MGTVLAAEAASFPWGAAAVVVIVMAALWVIACAVWPFEPCPHCEGGKKRSPTGKKWRNCRWCKGAGKRVRFGRRLWTALHKHE